MEIDDAITNYRELSKKIFVPRKRNIVGGRKAQNFIGNATFDAKVLEDEIKRITETSLLARNATFSKEDTTSAAHPIAKSRGKKKTIFSSLMKRLGRKDNNAKAPERDTTPSSPAIRQTLQDSPLYEEEPRCRM
jgi:hypothetical protein